ncbi:hypothetical protein QUA86_04575 [Microcoleus sp. F6_B6]
MAYPHPNPQPRPTPPTHRNQAADLLSNTSASTAANSITSIAPPPTSTCN